ncbi:MAG: two-component regulator propeller domain-containing protein [Bacteroidales bacterium]|nr:two-component regulator propeller domain-containing protein [Bacteroidales bacterium]
MKNLFSLFILLLLPLYLHGQATEKYMFRHLDVKEGLSNSQVNGIFKDSRGYMWFATAYGLNRYDGYSFRVFENVPGDSTSLPDNYVQSIQEYVDFDLLIRTSSGFSLFDAKKECFRDMTSYLRNQGINPAISCAYVDSLKNLWCYARGNGCTQWQNRSGKRISYPDALIADSSSDAGVVGMCESPQGLLLVYSSGRIVCLNRSEPKVVFSTSLPLATPASFSKLSLYVDREGVCWIFTKESTGLWSYQPATGVWSYFGKKASSTYQLLSDIVFDVVQDANGLIWVATDHGGVSIIDKNKGTVRTLMHDPKDEYSLPQNSLSTLYCDDQQIVWVGSQKFGVAYYAESLFKFGTGDVGIASAFDLDEDVNTLVEDIHGLLWFGTNGNGLFSVNRATGQTIHYKNRPGDDASLSDNVVVSLCASRDGRVWIGTYQGGMDCFHKGRITHYRHDSSNLNSPANNSIWAIKEDESGILWIGTLGKGLQRFDPLNNTFVTFNNESSSLLSSQYISSICIGRDRNLYLGTALGITVFDPKTNMTDFIYGNKQGNQRFSSQNINQVYEDSRGLLWVATRDGLNVLDRKSDVLTVLKESNGLPDAFICGILEDEFKNMWITTQKGICNVTVNVQPQEGTYSFSMIRYDRLDGLRSSEFNIRSIAATSTGEILMGGLQGVDRFNPKNLRYNKSLPRIVFTGLKLFDQQIRIDSLYDGNRILEAPLDMTRRIVLKSHQNMITVSFSIMNYILPEKVNFTYLLEGVDKEWKKAKGNMITRANLAPGTYTLRVKATNSDGYQNKEEATLVIVVQSSVWRSAQTLVIVLILLLLLVLSYRYRRLLCNLKQKPFGLQFDPFSAMPQATRMDSENSQNGLSSPDKLLLERAKKYVEDHISDSELSVEEMSREMGMSRGHLYKKLMAVTGKSPIEFIRVIRLNNAARLLQESQLNISEIAYKVGFNNPKYFSRYFKEQFGVLPSEYHQKAGHTTNDTPSGNI